MSDDKPKCAYEGCTHDILRDRKHCIFHLPKKTAEEKKELRPDQIAHQERIEDSFRVEYYKLLNDPSKDVFEFSGFQFPDIDLSKDKLKEKTGLDGFNKPVSFRDATFTGDANFHETEFYAEADFSYATFSGKADFSKAKFSGEVFFQRATFFGKATFIFTEFSGEAYFSSATFSGNAVFSFVTFSGKAIFEYATFSGNAYFGSTFDGEADFGMATFYGDAYFPKTTFSGEAIFEYATFSGKATFSSAKFSGNAYFICLLICEVTRVKFQKVNLSKASFLDTDLEQLTFRDVEWHSQRKEEQKKKNALWQKAIQFFLPNREIALWDEFRVLEKDEEERDYAKIAENYRQLILNYERKRDFEKADQFITGDMEVRRKRLGVGKQGWRKKAYEWFNGFNVYRILSNYGTSYWIALTALLLLFLAFSGVFMYSGVNRLNMGAYESVVNYDLFPLSDLQFVGWKQLGKDIQQTMSYSLSILPFQRAEQYRPFGVLTRAVKAVAVLLIYAQIAIFLLAIRRRFRHK
jgi:uncharacterized protein YjbI with pentapeptide repeats